jgi:hypothetical protein
VTLPLIIAIHTDDDLYRRSGDALRANLLARGIAHRIEVVPKTRFAAWADACYVKPEFILRMLRDEQRPLMCMDVDALVTGNILPEHFPENPIGLVRFPWGEWSSGCVFVRPGAEAFLEAWCAAIHAHKGPHPFTGDQAFLPRLVEKFPVGLLPVGYCKIFDRMKDIPGIVTHFQASRVSRGTDSALAYYLRLGASCPQDYACLDTITLLRREILKAAYGNSPRFALVGNGPMAPECLTELTEWQPSVVVRFNEWLPRFLSFPRCDMLWTNTSAHSNAYEKHGVGRPKLVVFGRNQAFDGKPQSFMACAVQRWYSKQQVAILNPYTEWMLPAETGVTRPTIGFNALWWLRHLLPNSPKFLCGFNWHAGDADRKLDNHDWDREAACIHSWGVSMSAACSLALRTVTGNAAH